MRPTLSHATAVSERLDYQFVDKDGIKNINEVPHRQKIYSKSEILYVSASHYHQGSYNLDTRALVGFYAAYVDISLTMFRENLSIASLRYQYCWTLKDATNGVYRNVGNKLQLYYTLITNLMR